MNTGAGPATGEWVGGEGGGGFVQRHRSGTQRGLRLTALELLSNSTCLSGRATHAALT